MRKMKPNISCLLYSESYYRSHLRIDLSRDHMVRLALSGHLLRVKALVLAKISQRPMIHSC